MAPQDSSHSEWEGSHENTGQKESFSNYDRESWAINDERQNSRVTTGLDRLFFLDDMETDDPNILRWSSPAITEPDSAYSLFDENTGYVDHTDPNSRVITERHQACLLPHEDGNTIRDSRQNGQGESEMVRTSALPDQNDAGYVHASRRMGQEMTGLDPNESLNAKSSDMAHAARPAGASHPAPDLNGAALADATAEEGQFSETNQTAGGNEDRASTGEKGDGPFTQSGYLGEKPVSPILKADQSRAGAQNGQSLEPTGLQNSVSPGGMTSGNGDALSESPISCHVASWPRALAERLHQVHQQGRSQMTLELEPNHLGKLSLRIETHQDRVTAFIAADNEQAKTMLLQNSSILREHLQAQGLQLDQFFVEVREDGSSSRRFFQQDGFTRRGGGSQQGARGMDKSELAAVTSVYGRTASQQLISLFA
jgi:flagellar hook-length control protein FliK